MKKNERIQMALVLLLAVPHFLPNFRSFTGIMSSK